MLDSFGVEIQTLPSLKNLVIDSLVNNDAMFISDLHLHPNEPKITKNFLDFCIWARGKTKVIYILGDFLHAWPGDDAIDDWSKKITSALADLVSSGIKIYFMSGNRDFLIGEKFLKQAKVCELLEPTVINLGSEKVLLVHGDRYCTDDISHQMLRILTRNQLFKRLFLKIPFKYRNKIVNKVRQYSIDHTKLKGNILTIPKSISSHLHKFKLNTVIHGHTHTPGLITHNDKYGVFYQYILSDWDEKPMIMCYNQTNKFYYSLFVGNENA